MKLPFIQMESKWLPKQADNHVFIFENIALQEGINEIKAVATSSWQSF